MFELDNFENLELMLASHPAVLNKMIQFDYFL